MASQAPLAPLAPLDLKNVQGDILAGGLPKKTQTFLFFQIDKNHVQDFRKQLTHFVPLITTSAQAISDQNKISQEKNALKGQLLKLSGINLSFTHKGLAILGINDTIGDPAFNAGMLNGAKDLGDKGASSASGFNPDWVPAFKKDIHGVILVTGDSHATVNEKLANVIKIFGVGTQAASIQEVITIVGDVRPGKEKGDFGYLDGISQPAVKGVDTVINNGQETVRQGIILLGREGDVPDGGATRPSWALDGSFLAFRYLFQLVPEFDAFKKSKATPEISEELFGARLMGRWKSGAPINITPTIDDPALGADLTRNNDFSFNAVFPNDQQTQNRCPFAAHVRKTNPRDDLEGLGFPTETKRIIRSGIPFGPEVTPEEAAKSKTAHDRGLLFVSYQSNIANGFQFVQQSWANEPNFPIKKPITPGIDPIIGQSPNGAVRTMSGVNPNRQGDELTLPTEWVLPKGGEYFFSPSIPALKHTFAVAT